MLTRLTQNNLYTDRVFETTGRQDKGVVMQFSDVRSLYPKQGISDAVVDYYVRYIAIF